MTARHAGRLKPALRLAAISLVGILSAIGLSGCIWTANADKELQNFAAFARALPNVTDVTAMHSAPTNPGDPFSDHTDAFATIVMGATGWREKLTPLADSVYDALSHSKTRTRVDYYITVYADGNRVQLSIDRAQNNREITVLLGGTALPGVTWVSVAGGIGAEGVGLVSVGRVPGTDVAAFVQDWFDRSRPLFTRAILTITSVASSPPRPAMKAPADPTDRTVTFALSGTLATDAIRWVADLDALPLTDGYVVNVPQTSDVPAETSETPPEGAALPRFGSTAVTITGSNTLGVIEPTLRASPGFVETGSLTFTYGRVTLVSIANTDVPLRRLVPLIAGDDAITKVLVGEASVAVTTSSSDAVVKLLETAATVPGTDATLLTVNTADGDHVQHATGMDAIVVNGTAFATVRKLLPSTARLVAALHPEDVYIKADGEVSVLFSGEPWNAKWAKLTIVTMRNAILSTGTLLEVRFDVMSGRSGHLDDSWVATITPADPLLSSDIEFTSSDRSEDTQSRIAAIRADWNGVS